MIPLINGLTERMEKWNLSRAELDEVNIACLTVDREEITGLRFYNYAQRLMLTYGWKLAFVSHSFFNS